MTQTPSKAIKEISIDLVQPYWRNPRNADAAVPYVAKSIERYGFVVPILVDPANVIIAGHTRYRAARQLGLAKVPVIVASLTEAQAREFRIADNKTHEKAQWDQDLLKAELLALQDIDGVATAFGGPEWDALLGRAPTGQPVEGDPQFGVLPDQKLEGMAGSRTDAYEVCCPHCGKENVIPIEPEVPALTEPATP